MNAGLKGEQMRRRTKFVLGVLAPLAMVGSVLATAAAGDNSTVTLRANLTGAQELQAADADGTGKAKVTIAADKGRLCWDISFRRAGTANRGHIHAGDAATNGPIVVAFFDLQASPADPRHDTLETKQKLSGCQDVEAALLADIIASPQNYYVNLHNARYPAGMMRCQLEA